VPIARPRTDSCDKHSRRACVDVSERDEGADDDDAADGDDGDRDDGD
jgi:hypothetical protein